MQIRELRFWVTTSSWPGLFVTLRSNHVVSEPSAQAAARRRSHSLRCGRRSADLDGSPAPGASPVRAQFTKSPAQYVQENNIREQAMTMALEELVADCKFGDLQASTVLAA